MRTPIGQEDVGLLIQQRFDCCPRPIPATDASLGQVVVGSEDYKRILFEKPGAFVLDVVHQQAEFDRLGECSWLMHVDGESMAAWCQPQDSYRAVRLALVAQKVSY